MPNHLTRLAAITAAGAMSMAAAGAASAADVTVTFEGVKAGGTLYVSLQTKDQFMQEANVASSVVPDVDAGEITVTLEDVTPGTYALSVWHDINGNGQFDMTPQGMPEDGWATKGGASLMGSPVFSQVSFQVTDEGYALTEPMIYPEFYLGQ